MARHGQLQASAERHTVNGHHHRLGTILDLAKQRKEAGSASRLPRRYLAELLNIRSGDERAPSTDDYGGFDTLVLVDLLDRLGNTFRHGGAEGIHRGIVDGDDRHIFIFRELN